MTLQLEARDLTLQTTSTASGSEVFSHSRFPANRDAPVLILIHGYPNTNYLWRKVIKQLPSEYPVFVPDIPGYGNSPPSPTGHDKRTLGLTILSALKSLVSASSSTSIPIVLAGHDRGARIVHRLAVDFAHPDGLPSDARELLQSFSLRGSACLDIVPETTQWSSFATAKVAASTFHWPFLANVEMATDMINAYGPGKWCRAMCERWSGFPDRIATEDALDVYAGAYEKPGRVKASCEDYAAGAGIDVDRQTEDQKAGRKVKGRFMAMYSEPYLGSRYDVPKVWGEWLEDGGKSAEFVSIGDGVGHFLPEEAPELVVEALQRFVQGA